MTESGNAASSDTPVDSGHLPRARWRARSGERATRELREKAEARSYRFLQIALDLLSEGGSGAVSVRRVVELSGMSLRMFYQSFAGRDDLFLAIYEEATLGGLERQLAAADTAGDNPLDRLCAFMKTEWSDAEIAPPELQRSLIFYHRRLRETRPTELAAILQPQHQAITDLLRACSAAGMVGPHLADSETASILVHLMVEMVQARLLGFHVGGDAIAFDQMWAFVVAIFADSQTDHRRSHA